MTAQIIIDRMFDLSDETRAEGQRRFFKTGKGEYGENDKFIGVNMPSLRATIKDAHAIPLDELEILLDSEFHEIRMAGLLILVQKYKKKKLYSQDEMVAFYLDNLAAANNWDLVDSTAYHILGDYLLDKPRETLYDLASSESVWFRRIAIVSTLALIKKRQYETTFELVEMLKHHKEDILQKALGWALREVIKKGGKVEGLGYIEKNKLSLPKKVISIAIEDLSPIEKSKVRGA
ncbi:3-methyladenine DNA glycosylase AlkD [Spirosomataceae bacterium TFI 002]|nr:3-methyladenine DNA glycosylase AlkD [Spirosomataceae bacterium TFI 002]